MFSQLLISTLAAAATVSALVPRDVCNADNCLRALRANSPKIRLAEAQKDCEAWLVVTVTPPVSTSTEFATVSLTETAVDQITVTDTIHTTITSTISETPTETVYTSTETSTVQAKSVTVIKRAAPTIPGYASPCSSAARYSSACSCIGISVAASTVTAPASTTTVTIPTTDSATLSVTEVVATASDVIIDTTVIETVTAPATTIFAVTTTTVTETSISQAPTPIAVKLTIEGAGRPLGFMGAYVTSFPYAIYVSEESQALSLLLHPDGSLWYNGNIAVGDPILNVGVFFIPPRVATPRKPLICTVDANDVLSCTVGGRIRKFVTNGRAIPAYISMSDEGTAAQPVVTVKIKRI